MDIFLVSSSKGLGSLQQGEMIDSMRLIREDLYATAYASTSSNYWIEV